MVLSMHFSASIEMESGTCFGFFVTLSRVDADCIAVSERTG